MLNLETDSEVASMLGTTAENFSRTLKTADVLRQKLTIQDLDKPEKGPREVYDPRGPLRALQNALLRKILLPRLDRSPHSFGGIEGRNHLDCAGLHAGQRFVYTADIRTFYPSIHFERVKNLYRSLGCSEEVTRSLTRLTTANHRLEQGFITSPIIADRIFRPMDERIARLCAKNRLTYTRYVDDITISGPFNLTTSGIPKTVSDILSGSGLPLNKDKNAFGSLSEGAAILGLRICKGRVDVRTGYHNETVRRLKDMATLGVGGVFTGPFFTRAELFGRVRYVCWVNPNRKAILFPLWRAVNWSRVHIIAAERGIVVRDRRFLIKRVPEVPSRISTSISSPIGNPRNAENRT